MSGDLRREYAARIEGDSDNPLRVSEANAVLRGERDMMVVAYAAARIAQLTEALRPFAKVAAAFNYWCAESMPDFAYPVATVDASFALEDCPDAIGELTEADFQRAAAALAPVPAGGWA